MLLLEQKRPTHECCIDSGHCLLFVWCFKIRLTIGILANKMAFLAKKDSLRWLVKGKNHLDFVSDKDNHLGGCLKR